MKSAIQELFYGSFANIEKLKLTQRQLKCLDAVIECDKKLRELFKGNEEVLELFEKFKRAMRDNADEEGFAYYKEGFRNGFRLALDVMEEE